MNLAAPAPRVSAASATTVADAEDAAAEPARPRLSPDASAPAVVEAAETVDDVMKYAPDTVKNKSTTKAAATSVEAIRGTSGSDFEGYVAVLRGAKDKNFLQLILPCFFDERDFVSYGEAVRYVLVKSDNCFVYTDQDSTSPLYAIPLHDLQAITEDPSNPELTSITISPGDQNISKADLETVLLKYSKSGKIAYQFTFNTAGDKTVSQRFMSAISPSGKGANERSDDKTASIIYAEKVAVAKAKGQPKDPNKR